MRALGKATGFGLALSVAGILFLVLGQWAIS